MVKLILRDDDWTINCKPRDLDPFVIAAKFFDEVILTFPKQLKYFQAIFFFFIENMFLTY